MEEVGKRRQPGRFQGDGEDKRELSIPLPTPNPLFQGHDTFLQEFQ